MRLSKKARIELKKILARSMGDDAANKFSNHELNDFGLKIMKLTAIMVKRKISEIEK